MPTRPAPTPPTPAPPRSPGPLARLFGLAGRPLHPVERTLLALTVMLVLVAVAVSVTDVTGWYGGIDVRNRVVGARLLAAGIDPYTFRWHPGMPEEWLDPVQRVGVTRVTLPPTGLCLYRAISWLPHGTIRVIHLGLEWAGLLAAVVVLVRVVPGRRLRVAFLVAAGVAFASGAAWRMHTERGQVYVLNLLLLSVGVSRALRAGLDSWWAGAAFGLAAALRPNLAPIALAFLVLGKYRTAAGTALAGGLGVLATLPWAGVDVWKSYLAMGDEYYLFVQTFGAEPPPPDVFPPDTAEGFDFSKTIVDAESPSTSIPQFYAVFGAALGHPVTNLKRDSKVVLAGFVAVLLGAFALGRRRPPRATLLVLVCVLMDMEYFLPHRWPYVDVQWLLPLALAAPAMASARPAGQVGLLLVLAGLVIGNNLALTTLPYTTTLLRSYLLAAGLTVVAYGEWARRAAPPPGPPA